MNEGSAQEKPTRDDVVKEFRVRALLEATRRVIGRHGFQGATIDRVAEEAGVAKGTIYLYFANKEDLLHAAVLQGLREMVRQIKEDGALATGSPLTCLKRLARNQFRMLNSNRDFLKALILEPSFASFKPGDSRANELLQVFTSHLEFLSELLGRAFEFGEIKRIDPQLGAFMLNELIIGSLRRRLLQLAATPIEADADAVIDLFLNGIAVRPNGAGE